MLSVFHRSRAKCLASETIWPVLVSEVSQVPLDRLRHCQRLAANRHRLFEVSWHQAL
jgi:hypothetical protein